MAESFFDRMFSKKPKKAEKPVPAPDAPASAAVDAANGLKFLANPKKATNKRIEDAEKAAGMKCGGKVKKMAFGGPTGMPPRAGLSRPLPSRPVGPMAVNRMALGGGGPQLQAGPIQRPPVDAMRTTPGGRGPMMKKGGSVRGGGCATKGIGKGKMR